MSETKCADGADLTPLTPLTPLEPLEVVWIDEVADGERWYTKQRRLRWEVLRRPLGMREGAELNPHEAELRHCVAVVAGEVVGTVSWHPEPGAASGKLVQMAVEPAWERRGVGARLVRALEARAASEGAALVHMHARALAVGFYAKLGYRVEGEPFEQIGISHVVMCRRLDDG